MCYAEYRVKAAPATGFVEDGDVLDLGNRVLQVLHTPGHSPGGISLFEAATETLFSGDIIYDGPLIEDAYHSNLDDYAAVCSACTRCRSARCMAATSAVFPGSICATMIDEWQRCHA